MIHWQKYWIFIITGASTCSAKFSMRKSLSPAKHNQQMRKSFSLSLSLSAFASSTEAELRVSYALTPWSVSIFCVPLRLCAKWVSWPSDSDFGDWEVEARDWENSPTLFEWSQWGLLGAMNHRQFTHHSAFDDQSSSTGSIEPGLSYY